MNPLQNAQPPESYTLAQELAKVADGQQLMDFANNLEESDEPMSYRRINVEGSTDLLELADITEKINQINQQDKTWEYKLGDSNQKLIVRVKKLDASNQTAASAKTSMVFSGSSATSTASAASAASAASEKTTKAEQSQEGVVEQPLEKQVRAAESINDLKRILAPLRFKGGAPDFHPVTNLYAQQPMFIELGGKKQAVEYWTVKVALERINKEDPSYTYWGKQYTIDLVSGDIRLETSKEQMARADSVGKLQLVVNSLKYFPATRHYTSGDQDFLSYNDVQSKFAALKSYEKSSKLVIDRDTGKIRDPNFKDDLEKIQSIDQLKVFLSTLEFFPEERSGTYPAHYEREIGNEKLEISDLRKKIEQLKQSGNFDIDATKGGIVPVRKEGAPQSTSSAASAAVAASKEADSKLSLEEQLSSVKDVAALGKLLSSLKFGWGDILKGGGTGTIQSLRYAREGSPKDHLELHEVKQKLRELSQNETDNLAINEVTGSINTKAEAAAAAAARKMPLKDQLRSVSTMSDLEKLLKDLSYHPADEETESPAVYIKIDGNDYKRLKFDLVLKKFQSLNESEPSGQYELDLKTGKVTSKMPQPSTATAVTATAASAASKEAASEQSLDDQLDSIKDASELKSLLKSLIYVPHKKRGGFGVYRNQQQDTLEANSVVLKLVKHQDWGISLDASTGELYQIDPVTKKRISEPAVTATAASSAASVVPKQSLRNQLKSVNTIEELKKLLSPLTFKPGQQLMNHYVPGTYSDKSGDSINNMNVYGKLIELNKKENSDYDINRTTGAIENPAEALSKKGSETITATAPTAASAASSAAATAAAEKGAAAKTIPLKDQIQSVKTVAELMAMVNPLAFDSGTESTNPDGTSVSDVFVGYRRKDQPGDRLGYLIVSRKFRELNKKENNAYEIDEDTGKISSKKSEEMSKKESEKITSTITAAATATAASAASALPKQPFTSMSIDQALELPGMSRYLIVPIHEPDPFVEFTITNSKVHEVRKKGLNVLGLYDNNIVVGKNDCMLISTNVPGRFMIKLGPDGKLVAEQISEQDQKTNKSTAAPTAASAVSASANAAQVSVDPMQKFNKILEEIKANSNSKDLTLLSSMKKFVPTILQTKSNELPNEQKKNLLLVLINNEIERLDNTHTDEYTKIYKDSGEAAAAQFRTDYENNREILFNAYNRLNDADIPANDVNTLETHWIALEMQFPQTRNF